MPSTRAARSVGLSNESGTPYLKPDGPINHLNLVVINSSSPSFTKLNLNIITSKNYIVPLNGTAHSSSLLSRSLSLYSSISSVQPLSLLMLSPSSGSLSYSVENKLCRAFTLLRGVSVFISVWGMVNDDTSGFESLDAVINAALWSAHSGVGGLSCTVFLIVGCLVAGIYL